MGCLKYCLQSTSYETSRYETSLYPVTFRIFSITGNEKPGKYQDFPDGNTSNLSCNNQPNSQYINVILYLKLTSATCFDSLYILVREKTNQ
jgi:hypothetical protein